MATRYNPHSNLIKVIRLEGSGTEGGRKSTGRLSDGQAPTIGNPAARQVAFLRPSLADS